jgi:superfamily II DNA helicase RecQ
MALREAPQRPLRQWDLQDAEKLLHRFYGSAATWKTANQKLAMKRILQGYSRVVAILATGEGKSLLYQLLTQLAHAATTVVLVPLVALKFGM